MPPMTAPEMVFFGLGMLFLLLVALRPMQVFRVLSYGRRFGPGEPMPRAIRIIQMMAAAGAVMIAIGFVVDVIQRL